MALLSLVEYYYHSAQLSSLCCHVGIKWQMVLPHRDEQRLHARNIMLIKYCIRDNAQRLLAQPIHKFDRTCVYFILCSMVNSFSIVLCLIVRRVFATVMFLPSQYLLMCFRLSTPQAETLIHCSSSHRMICPQSQANPYTKRWWTKDLTQMLYILTSSLLYVPVNNDSFRIGNNMSRCSLAKGFRLLNFGEPEREQNWPHCPNLRCYSGRCRSQNHYGMNLSS
jgi:hypothetical protein